MADDATHSDFNKKRKVSNLCCPMLFLMCFLPLGDVPNMSVYGDSVCVALESKKGDTVSHFAPNASIATLKGSSLELVNPTALTYRSAINSLIKV